jgi:K+/H+ antiporter YhaU regulatory subunit KhtT
VTPETVLQGGDIIVLRGTAESVARAEKRLLKA